jgi:hypothetical protein
MPQAAQAARAEEKAYTQMEIDVLERVQEINLTGIGITAEFKHEIKHAAEHAVMLKFFEFRSKRGYSPFKPDHKYFGGIAGAGPSSPAATQVAENDSDWSSTPSSVGSPAPKKVARGLF